MKETYNICAEHYFYPLISSFPPYDTIAGAGIGNLPNAQKAADEVLCLPMYAELGKKSIEYICNVILSE